MNLHDVMRKEIRALSAEEQKLMAEIKQAGQDLWDKLHSIEVSTGISRELAIAKTKIEEAVMWATKHVTRSTPANADPAQPPPHIP